MNEELEDYITQLDKLSITTESILVELVDETLTDNSDLINELFRSIHSMKAATHYHDFEEISILLEKTEDIIYFIRNYSCCINDDIVTWFNNLVIQLNVWIKQIQNDETPEFYALDFETAPVVTCKKYSSPKMNEVYEIIILNRDYKVTSILIDILEAKFKYVRITATISETISILSTPGKKILISDLKFADGNILELIKNLNDINFNLEDLIILSKFNKPESVQLFKDKLKLDRVYNVKTMKMSEIKTIVVDKCEHKDSEIEIPINNGKITLIELAQFIEPLPDTLIRLKDACFSPDTAIRDITKIIENDPMFSAIVLRSINSPYIGLTNRVSKVSIAVSLLGKKQIGSMTIVESAKDGFGDANLEAYNIHLTNLIDISLKRTHFVTEWLKYIDLDQDAKDDIISLIHLMPLGMVITNQAIVHDKMVDRFRNLSKGAKSIVGIESALIGFNNLEALEKLFTIWNMPHNIKRIIAAVKEYGFESPSRVIQVQAHIINLSY